MNAEDIGTKLLRIASLVFYASHPRLVSICIVSGLATKGILFIIQPSYPHVALINSAAALAPLYYVSFYLAISFSVQYLWGKPGLSERARSHLEVIEGLCERSNLSITERRQLWRELLHRYIKKTAPDLNNPIPDLRDLRKPDINLSHGQNSFDEITSLQEALQNDSNSSDKIASR
jgi:hypothetical protein